MKNLDLFSTCELSESERKNVNGGISVVGGFLIGYLAGEVLEGIQRGISNDCSKSSCC